jgi:hypothetical protein
MRANRSQDRAWMQTLALLKAISGAAGNSECPNIPDCGNGQPHAEVRPSSDVPCASFIRAIVRASPRTVKLSWSDPTSCCYCEQLWRVGMTKKSGRCAMSGKRIRRGDAVYKPYCKSGRPRNADAMILSSVLDEAAPDCEVWLENVLGTFVATRYLRSMKTTNRNGYLADMSNEERSFAASI